MTSNVLLRIMASCPSYMACCQFSFSGLSIAYRYVSGSSSEPVSVLFSFLGAFHSFPVRQRVSFSAHERICHHRGNSCFPYVSGSPSEPVSALPSLLHWHFLFHAFCHSSCFDAFFWAELLSFCFVFLFDGLLLPALHQCDPDCL